MCFTHCNWSIRVEKESSHGYIKFYFQCSSVVVCPDRSLYWCLIKKNGMVVQRTWGKRGKGGRWEKTYQLHKLEAYFKFGLETEVKGARKSMVQEMEDYTCKPGYGCPITHIPSLKTLQSQKRYRILNNETSKIVLIA